MILDLFAGCGGWDVGARTLGLDPIGIELDEDACRTRHAAGLRTIRADVETFLHGHLGKADGLIASPPCQDFSMAGNRAGIEGDRGRLMWSVPAYVDALRPRWVACEQVPPALPWWERFADLFVPLGYRCWTGILNSADHGVPQTRKRAFLLASKDRQPYPPAPTHAKAPTDGLFGTLRPWVSMAEALGWDTPREVIERRGQGRIERHGDRTPTPSDEPYPTLTSGETRRHWVVDRRTNSHRSDDGTLVPTVPVSCDRPSPTLTGLAGGQWVLTDGQARGKLSVRDGLILQSFPADYPVQGTKTSQWRQIGNAVAPRLAAHVLESVV